MYVARFTLDPEADIRRGWSGYQDGQAFPETVEEALDAIGHLPDDDELEEKQERWIRTYGDQYEDWDTFRQEYLEEVAENVGLVKDEETGQWRVFHHDGLSCWALKAMTPEDAVAEAAERATMDNTLSARFIGWFGVGQQTEGEVKVICQVEGVDYLWILECDDASEEI